MSEKELSFEDIMNNLEGITNELEQGNLNLDESVKKFEEGMELSKKASKILEDAEKKITILIEKNGDVEEEDFKQTT